MITILGGCGNKGNSDFTKEEKDDFYSAFSDDEIKELEAEFGGSASGSSSKKTTQYDETVTIDPFEGVQVIISGTEPDITYIDIEKPESEYSSEVHIHIADDIDKESLTAGDTVTVVAEFLLDNKTKLEKKLQKNVEFSRDTIELEVIADSENYKRLLLTWDELTEEQKNEILTYATENIEAEADDNYWELFNTDDHEVGLLDHSESYTISDPVGIYWCCISDISPCVNYAAIGFELTDASNYTMTVYFPIEYMIVDENTGEFEWTHNKDKLYSTAPGITDLAKIEESRSVTDHPKYSDNGCTFEYISLR